MAQKNAKVLEDFIAVTPTKKIEQSTIKHNKIVAAVSTFANPDLDMVTFKKDIDNADDLIKKVDAGDKSKTEERNAAIRLLDADLRLLAAYVTRIAKGSEAIIQLAGFTSIKTIVTKAKVPQQPVITGGPGKLIGELALESNKLEFATRYTFVASEDLSLVSFDNGTVIVTIPPVVEGTTPTTQPPIYIRTEKKNKTIINNLETRKEFQCVCFASSTAGSSVESEIIVAKSL
ncbi:MAG: hypothetical protein WCP52_04825 [Bacteroidota bacterium]